MRIHLRLDFFSKSFFLILWKKILVSFAQLSSDFRGILGKCDLRNVRVDNYYRTPKTTLKIGRRKLCLP